MREREREQEEEGNDGKQSERREEMRGRRRKLSWHYRGVVSFYLSPPLY